MPEERHSSDAYVFVCTNAKYMYDSVWVFTLSIVKYTWNFSSQLDFKHTFTAFTIRLHSFAAIWNDKYGDIRLNIHSFIWSHSVSLSTSMCFRKWRWWWQRRLLWWNVQHSVNIFHITHFNFACLSVEIGRNFFPNFISLERKREQRSASSTFCFENKRWSVEQTWEDNRLNGIFYFRCVSVCMLGWYFHFHFIVVDCCYHSFDIKPNIFVWVRCYCRIYM